MKKNASVWLACLMLILFVTPALEAQSSEQQTECEKALTELEQTCVDELTKLSNEYEERLRQLEQDCAAAIQTAVAETAKPLLVEIAGLKAERRQRIWWGVGGLGVGIVAGVLVTLLLN